MLYLWIMKFKAGGGRWLNREGVGVMQQDFFVDVDPGSGAARLTAQSQCAKAFIKGDIFIAGNDNSPHAWAKFLVRSGFTVLFAGIIMGTTQELVGEQAADNVLPFVPMHARGFGSRGGIVG